MAMTMTTSAMMMGYDDSVFVGLRGAMWPQSSLATTIEIETALCTTMAATAATTICDLFSHFIMAFLVTLYPNTTQFCL